jgi:hypothetical protein
MFYSLSVKSKTQFYLNILVLNCLNLIFEVKRKQVEANTRNGKNPQKKLYQIAFYFIHKNANNFILKCW